MKAAIDDDYALALRLQNEEDANARNGNVMWRSASTSNRVASEYEQWEQNPNLRIPPDTDYAYSPKSVSAINVDTTSPRYDASGHVIHEDPMSSDTRYAYFLQLMEFEIQDDLQENRHEDFENREIASSNWKKQLMTPSTVLCVIQIAFLIAMVSQVRSNTIQRYTLFIIPILPIVPIIFFSIIIYHNAILFIGWIHDFSIQSNVRSTRHNTGTIWCEICWIDCVSKAMVAIDISYGTSCRSSFLFFNQTLYQSLSHTLTYLLSTRDQILLPIHHIL